jgi:ribonuclease VapC
LIVVDTSALIAIVLDEPEGQRCALALVNERVIGLSAVSLVEAGIVLEGRHGATVAGELDLLVETLDIEVVPVDATHVSAARQAFRRYGKGRHPAALNFGDCFAYALARLWVAPLLFVGDNFAKTDIVAA